MQGDPQVIEAALPYLRFVIGSSVILAISMVIDSVDDPRFAGGSVLLPVASAGAVYVFSAGELSPCLSYTSEATGRQVDTGLVLSSSDCGGDQAREGEYRQFLQHVPP